MLTPHQRRIQENISEVQELFNKEGYDVSVDGSELFVDDPPPRNSFPLIIFTFAMIKDVLDLLDLTLILMIITKILSIFMSIAIFLWLATHMSGRWWKTRALKRIVRMRWIKLILAQVIEMIPIIGILPLNAWYILWAHHQEKKLVQIFDKLLKRIA